MADPNRFSPADFRLPTSGLDHYEIVPNYEYSPAGFEEMQERTPEVPERRRILISGICEYVIGVRRYASLSMLSVLQAHLVHFGKVYERLGYYGPLMIWYRLTNTDQTEFEIARGFVGHKLRLDVPEYQIPPIQIYTEQLLREPPVVLRDIANYVWKAYGQAGCPYFDEDGNFIGRIIVSV